MDRITTVHTASTTSQAATCDQQALPIDTHRGSALPALVPRPPMMSLKEVAAHWDVVVSTAGRRLRSNDVPFVKEGDAASSRVFVDPAVVAELDRKWGWHTASGPRIRTQDPTTAPRIPRQGQR